MGWGWGESSCALGMLWTKLQERGEVNTKSISQICFQSKPSY